MDSWIHPALFFFLGALLLPFLKGRTKKAFILLVPAVSILAVASTWEAPWGLSSPAIT